MARLHGDPDRDSRREQLVQRAREDVDRSGRPRADRHRRARPQTRASVSSTQRHTLPHLRLGQHDLLILGRGVEHDQERVVDHRLAELVGHRDAVAVEEHLQRARHVRGPVLVGHLDAVGREPRDIGLRSAPAPCRIGRPWNQPRRRNTGCWRRNAATSAREREQLGVGAPPSRTTRPRCPGSTRCCCRPASGRSRRRRAASARPATGTSWSGSCAAGGAGSG